MYETLESESHSEAFATSNTNGGTISNGELQNVQATYQLKGKNYLTWSQLIKTFLKGKGKISHLLGTGPKKIDLSYASWDDEDSLVMFWLWNSMIPERSVTQLCSFP